MRWVRPFPTVNTDERAPRYGNVELDGDAGRQVEACPQKLMRGQVDVKWATQLVLCDYHRRFVKRLRISSGYTERNVWIIGIDQVNI